MTALIDVILDDGLLGDPYRYFEGNTEIIEPIITDYSASASASHTSSKIMTHIDAEEVMRLIPRFEYTDIPYCDTGVLMNALGTQTFSQSATLSDSDNVYRILVPYIRNNTAPAAKNQGHMVCLCVCTCQFIDRSRTIPPWITQKLENRSHRKIENTLGFVGWLMTHGIKRDGLRPIKKQDRLQMYECVMGQIEHNAQQNIESLLESEGILIRSRSMTPPKTSNAGSRTDIILKYRIDTWRIMESRYSLSEIDQIDNEIRSKDEPPCLRDHNDIGVYVTRTCRYIILNEKIPAWISNSRNTVKSSEISNVDLTLDENTTHPRLLYGILTRIICKITKQSDWKLSGQLMFWLSGAICDQCTIQDHRRIVKVIPPHLQAELLGKTSKSRSKTVQGQGYWN